MNERFVVFALAAGPLLLAFALDRLWGDPREGSVAERWYPPVIVGRAAEAIDTRVRRGDPAHEARWGALGWVVLAACATAPAVALCWLVGSVFLGLSGTPSLIGLVVGVLALGLATFWLKSTFSVRTLERFCTRPLDRPLPEMRREVADVVNRPTAELPPELLYSALVESAVENTTDSVVSPLLAYSLLGLPGAVAYRVVNTLDALWGHQEPRWRHFGRFAARVDTAVNYLPDRLASAFLKIVARRPFTVPAIELRDPTAKVPATIRTAAGLLHVRLERSGSYVIGRDWRWPTPDDVRQTVSWVRRTSGLMLLVDLAVIGVLTDVGWTYFLH